MIETGGLDKGFDKNLNSRLPLRLMCGLFQSAAAVPPSGAQHNAQYSESYFNFFFQKQYRRFLCNIKTVLVFSAYVHSPKIKIKLQKYGLWFVLIYTFMVNKI